MLKFLDARKTLPRHATKRFGSRDVSQIAGIVVHQTAGGDSVTGTARYHVEPNHVSSNGCPGLLYTFFIRMDGEIWWANDLDAETWSQGGRGSPVPGTDPNKNFLAVVLGGDFDGPDYKGDDGHPTVHQLHALLCLTQHLTGASQHSELPGELFRSLSCLPEALYGHHNFGKPACPGVAAKAVVDAVRSHLLVAEVDKPWTTTEWQQALADLRYLGTADVDGVWGALSRCALVEYQQNYSLTPDGYRGPLTQAHISGNR